MPTLEEATTVELWEELGKRFRHAICVYDTPDGDPRLLGVLQPPDQSPVVGVGLCEWARGSLLRTIEDVDDDDEEEGD